jgi:HipA-like protein
MTALRVLLGEVEVGTLQLEPSGSTFLFDAGYLDRPRRPVLGQWFEDRLGLRPRAFKRSVPEWFENLLPEQGGRVRRRITRELGCAEEDDAAILVALGADLPGAVRVVPTPSLPTPGHPAAHEPVLDVPPGLRSSLGGFQLKFTLSGSPDRLTLPVADDHGVRWILKVAPESAYPRLAQNEAAVSRWLAAAGFDVPEVHVIPREAFPDGEDDPPDQPVPAAHRDPGAGDAAEELRDRHREREAPVHVAPRDEHRQRGEVRGEVHDLGLRGRAHQADAEEPDLSHDQEGPGPRPEEPVVRAEHQRQRETPRGRAVAGHGLERGPQRDREPHPDEQHQDQRPQRRGRDRGHQRRPGERSDEPEREPPGAVAASTRPARR